MENRGRNIYDYLQILYKWRWMIISVTILAGIFSVYKALVTTRVYETNAVLRIEMKTPSIGIMNSMGAFPMVDPIQTQMELVKSRTLLTKVVDNLGLNFSLKEVNDMDTIYFDSLFVDGEKIVHGKYKLEIISKDGKFKFYPIDLIKNVESPGESIGYLNKRFTYKGVSFIPRALNWKNKSYAIVSLGNSRYLVRSLRRMLNVTQIKNSELIELKMKGSDPQKTAEILNGICYMFKVQSIEHDREEAKNARVFIEQQLTIAEQTLKSIEDSLRLFKEKEGIVSLSSQTEQEIRIISDIQSEEVAINIELASINAKIKSSEKYLKGSAYYDDYVKLSNLPEINSNAALLELQKQIIEMEMERSTLAQQYTENHPDVKTLDESISEAKQKMSQMTNTSIKDGISYINDPVYQSIIKDIISAKIYKQFLIAKLDAINKEIENYKNRIRQLPLTETKMAELLRKKQLGENTYNMLMSKLEEARISEAMQIGNIRIVDKAMVPYIPVYPKRRIMVMLITMIGFMVSVAMAFIIEYLDNTVHNPEEVEKISGSTVLGSIPYLKNKKKNKKDIKLITYFNPKDPVSEIFRNIRTNVNFMSVDNPIKVILVSSPHPGEGKSTVATNLAVTYAQNGNRTLVVDADMRKPNIHVIFNIPKMDGLSEILVSNTFDNIDKYKKDVGIENLTIITAGITPPNPAELLNSQKMRDLLQLCRDKYDIIIIDSPPVLPVADPRILSSMTDGMILVVMDNKTDISGLKEAFKQIRAVDAKILGTIYNGVNLEHSYGAYKYRYYSSYYYYDNSLEQSGFVPYILNYLNKLLGKIKK